MTDFLYRTEAKGIQSWILGSDRLRELRGGSNILVQLDKDVKHLAGLCGAEVVIATAGGATLLFHEIAALRAFAENWPLYVAQRAPGLQIIQAWGLTMEDVRAKLGGARNFHTPDLPVAGPLVARSGRTGLPAVQRGRDGGFEDRIVQTKLAVKRGDHDALREILLGAGNRREFISNAEDFDDGYIGVIHIDGNSVGQRVMEFGNKLKELEKFSEALRVATHTAARNTFAELIQRQKPKGDALIQARPIVLGGDDLTVIVHGQFAIPFAEFYLREFQRETSSLGKMTACAGIAIVKSSWPFSHAHTLAEDLCRAAKKYLDRKSGLLFHRVTTADSDLRWDDIRNSELNCEDSVLAGGPWLLDSLRKLDELCMVASEMPRGSLRGWLSESRVSRIGAQARWDRLREVAIERGNWQKFDGALQALHVNTATGWNDKQTPVPDALMWINLQSVRDQEPTRLWSTP